MQKHNLIILHKTCKQTQNWNRVINLCALEVLNSNQHSYNNKNNVQIQTLITIDMIKIHIYDI